MDFAHRLRAILRNRRRSHPVPNVRAGRVAELQVAQILDARLRGSGWEFSAGVRVRDGSRRFEIDVVVTTPDEVWLVELKNWTGFVGLDEGKIIQHRAGGRGVIDHGDLLGKLHRKERALQRFIRNATDSDEPQFWSVLVFCNDSVGLDEGLVGRQDLDVVTLREFVGALPLDVSSPKPPSAPIEATRRALSTLPTWDLLYLYGGQIISGDLVAMSTPGLADRAHFKGLDVDVPRGFFDLFRSELSIAVTAHLRDGNTEQFDVALDETVQFRGAGQSKPQQFALRDLVAIQLG